MMKHAMLIHAEKSQDPIHRTPAVASVLVVDDEEPVRTSLSRALGSLGFDVATAADATDAVLRFVLRRPDIVLLDLGMPGESGWDVFEEMSRLDPLVPVVIVTARPGQISTAREACVAALVEKPVSIPDLAAVIDRLLEEDPAARLSRLVHRPPATIHLGRNRHRPR